MKSFMLLMFAFYTFWVGLKIRPTDAHPKAMVLAGALYLSSAVLAIASFLVFLFVE